MRISRRFMATEPDQEKARGSCRDKFTMVIMFQPGKNPSFYSIFFFLCRLCVSFLAIPTLQHDGFQANTIGHIQSLEVGVRGTTGDFRLAHIPHSFVGSWPAAGSVRVVVLVIVVPHANDRFDYIEYGNPSFPILYDAHIVPFPR